MGATVGSLLPQVYPGRFSVVVVDDQSTDGTAEAAKQAAVAAGAPVVYDAPDALERLVRGSLARATVLTSLTVKLRCESFAERLLIPAFVFFFQKLYPFAWVNDPAARAAAAAGGCTHSTFRCRSQSVRKGMALRDAPGAFIILASEMASCSPSCVTSSQSVTEPVAERHGAAQEPAACPLVLLHVRDAPRGIRRCFPIGTRRSRVGGRPSLRTWACGMRGTRTRPRAFQRPASKPVTIG